MEINKLKTFIDLARTLSFSTTAENLYVSQSSVSKQIKSLEKELGQALFWRSNKGVVISNYGASILNEATQMVELNDQVIAKAARLNRHHRWLIRLAVIPSFSDRDIFKKAMSYRQAHPEVRISLHETETNEIPQLLDQGKVDLAYMRTLTDPAEQNCEYILTSRENFVVCLNRHHPLAHEKVVNLAQLKDENFIMLAPNSLLDRPVIDLCHKAGFVPRISFVSERVSSIIQMVKNNQGIAILMQPHRTKRDVALRPLVPSQSSYLFFVRGKHGNSPAVTDYWNYLQKFAMPNRNS